MKVTGTWTSLTFNRDLLWIYDTKNPSNSPNAASFANQAYNECVLNQLPGTVYNCVQQGATWVPGNVSIDNVVRSEVTDGNPMPEGTTWTMAFEEDFGNAPVSYDATNGASHLLSDLRIGASVAASGAESSLQPGAPANNAGASGIVTPNPGGADAGSDAFASAPDIPMTGDYTIVVPISGASSAGRMCGFLDLNLDGSFDASAPEQRCANFTAGATSVTLSWPRSVLPSTVGWSSWLRLRASYDTTGVNSPLGRLDSGEVEDWQVTVVDQTPLGDPVVPVFTG